MSSVARAGPETSAADVERFLGPSPAVVAVEGAWLGRLRSCRLYRYHLPPATSAWMDEGAGPILRQAGAGGAAGGRIALFQLVGPETGEPVLFALDPGPRCGGRPAAWANQ
jgi:hypothetical protein